MLDEIAVHKCLKQKKQNQTSFAGCSAGDEHTGFSYELAF